MVAIELERIPCMAALDPTRRVPALNSATSARDIVRARAAVTSALLTVSSTASGESGFSMKWKAPELGGLDRVAQRGTATHHDHGQAGVSFPRCG